MGFCKSRLLLALVVVMSIMALTGVASAEWPDKSITVYVGFSAGGATDFIARTTCMGMESSLGQRILATNVNGAIGSIAGTQVANAPADGYSWFGGAQIAGTWPVMGHSKTSWEDFYSFVAVVFPTTIYVKANSPYKTFQDYIDAINNAPEGKVFKFGHPGAGSCGAIFAGLVMNAAGVSDKVQSVPYKGGREAGRYLLSGDVDFVSVTMGDLSDWATAGRVRPLLNLYDEDVEFEKITYPSLKHMFPQLVLYQNINPHFGIHLSRKTPDDIVIKVAKAFVESVSTPEFMEKAVKQRAGVWRPLFGIAADKEATQIESGRGWALWDMGIASKNPADLGIPKMEDWKWPPYERAQNIKPWPLECEKIFQELTR